MDFINRWANSEHVKIHFLESDDYDKRLTPLVYVPGALNYAEQSVELLQEFESRRSISISLRGRGKSDKPTLGYSFADHVKDIEAVIMHSQVQKYCPMAYSMGVPYTLKFASNSSEIKGLILCDYPAKYPSIPESWSERVLRSSYTNKQTKHVVEGIQKESQSITLYNELKQIQVPVLIIKGGTDGSLLSEVEAEKYNDNLQNVIVKEIVDSGHELWESEKERFLQLTKDFLVRLDNS
ncbi:alpha/beta fold hydrolase [Viridibacillus sp. NPDC093762]|uniref:alpha/beta fold hydrolase n=1 Tax=Viridibacillus sp. NPDC093762 TaxID=3390720 RepID=UPI003CFDD9F9